MQSDHKLRPVRVELEKIFVDGLFEGGHATPNFGLVGDGAVVFYDYAVVHC